eukprot:4411633-Prymnesium_polylepis.1
MLRDVQVHRAKVHLIAAVYGAHRKRRPEARRRHRRRRSARRRAERLVLQKRRAVKRTRLGKEGSTTARLCHRPQIRSRLDVVVRPQQVRERRVVSHTAGAGGLSGHRAAHGVEGPGFLRDAVPRGGACGPRRVHDSVGSVVGGRACGVLLLRPAVGRDEDADVSLAPPARLRRTRVCLAVRS